MILGQTLSGKSTLAKKLAREYKANGIGVIVLDPVGDPEWQADYSTPDPETFFDVYNKSRSCMAFIDESGDICKDYPALITRTATRGRHRGHRNHYIAQRATLINPTIRDQCSELFLFNSGLEDCKVHAAEWNAPDLRTHGPFLKTGEFFHKKRMGELNKISMFNN